MTKSKDEVIASRLDDVRGNFSEWGVEAILIDNEYNRRWLSGFKGSTGYLLLTENEAFIGTDSRYWERAEEESPNFTLYKVQGSYDAAFEELVKQVGVSQIGFEADHVSVERFDKLSQIDGIDWTKVSQMLVEFRQVKNDWEVATIQSAAEITDSAMALVNSLARPGVTEQQLAWLLEKSMREMGATRLSFPVIVASGPNAARPHHSPGDRAFQAGDVIIVDMGARVDGYCSDMTRTFFLGDDESGQFETIYNIVLESQLRALDKMRAGMNGKEIDSLSRDVIVQAEYGQQFGHGLGHGVGLEIHEMPRLSSQADEKKILPGTVVTVEPGIYIPGWGGVRIEDLVLMTEDGSRILSKCPKVPRISA